MDIDTTDGYGKTPLWHASFVGRAKIVDFLVSQGAAIWRAPWSGNYDGMSCYDIAKDQGNTAVVKIYEKNALSTGVVLEQAPELTPEQQAKKNQARGAVVLLLLLLCVCVAGGGCLYTAPE